MIKNKKCFLIWAAASLFCMAVIFVFSSFNADQSGGMSDSIVSTQITFFHDWFGLYASSVLIHVLSLIVRKSAHVFIFLMLGVCAANTMRYLTDNGKVVFWASLGWCSFYGATDELHQYFVPGRACMWQDWVLDIIGAFIGIGFVFIYMRRQKFSPKQKKLPPKI